MRARLLLVSQLAKNDLLSDEIDLLILWCVLELHQEGSAEVTAAYATHLFEFFLVADMCRG